MTEEIMQEEIEDWYYKFGDELATIGCRSAILHHEARKFYKKCILRGTLLQINDTVLVSNEYGEVT